MNRFEEPSKEGLQSPRRGGTGRFAIAGGPGEGDPLSDDNFEALLRLLDGLDEEALRAIFEEYLRARERGGG